MVSFQIGDASPGVATQAAPYHSWVFPDGTLWTEFFRVPQGYVIRFPSVGDYAVDHDGRKVTASPRPGVSHAAVESIYLNQVLPLAWSRQGRLVFHASAVEIDGCAVAFVGHSGRGKSTLAASFAADGGRLLCDDGLLLAASGNAFSVVPGHHSIRLWPDSESALFSQPLARSSPVEYTSKSRLVTSGQLQFCGEERPLAAVFFLGPGTAPSISIRPLRASEAFAELVKHSFLIDTEERAMLASHFDALSNLAALPLHRQLDYTRTYELLPHVRAAVVQCASERHAHEQASHS